MPRKTETEEITATDPTPLYSETGDSLDADQAIMDRLAEPFPQDKVRINYEKNPYYDIWTVVQRFQEVLGANWNTEVKHSGLINRQVTRMRNNQAVTEDVLEAWAVVGITIVLPSGAMVTREQAGGQVVTKEVGDALKGAASDAFKKAASYFGVGGELYVKGPERTAPSGSYNSLPTSGGYQSRPQPSANGEGGFTCGACDNPVTGWPDIGKSPQDVANIATRKYGMPLCKEHYSSAKAGNVPTPKQAVATGSDLESLPF